MLRLISMSTAIHGITLYVTRKLESDYSLMSLHVRKSKVVKSRKSTHVSLKPSSVISAV